MSVRREREWSTTTRVLAGPFCRFVHPLHHALVEVLACLRGHLLHKPRHALGIAFVEVAQAARVGQRLEASLFGFGGGDAGHEAGQPITATVLAARRLGIADAPDEVRGALT